MRINTIRMISGVSAAIMLLAVTGCETMNHRGGDERSEGRMVDDKDITASVQKGLDQDPVYKFNDVSVGTFAGVVQLSGFVNESAQRMRAQDIAQNTEGVSKVINGIALKPMLQPTGRAPVQRMYSDYPSTTPQAAPAPNTGENNMQTPNQNQSSEQTNQNNEQKQ
jgi:hypothetical protein